MSETIKITIERVSQGTQSSTDRLAVSTYDVCIAGLPVQDRTVFVTQIPTWDYVNLIAGYAKAIGAGVDTSAVETAIAAL